MAGIGDYAIIGFGPAFVEFVCGDNGAYSVVAALNDYGGNAADAVDVIKKLAIGREQIVLEVMGFHEGERRVVILILCRFLRWEERQTRDFVLVPSLDCFASEIFIVARKNF